MFGVTTVIHFDDIVDKAALFYSRTQFIFFELWIAMDNPTIESKKVVAFF
jgi:hypothetical protein